MFARMGIALRGDLQRDGATVTVTGQSGEIVLPFDAGVLSWQATDTVMTETGDGAVEIDLTAPQTVTVALHLTDAPEYDASAAFTTRFVNPIGHASGTPEAIRLSIIADRMDFTLDSFDAGPGFDAEGVQTRLFVTVFEPVTQLDIESGPLMQVSLTQRGTRAVSDAQFQFDDASSHAVVDLTESLGAVTAMLPETPVDFLNLAPALRAGLVIEAESRAMAVASQTMTQSGGLVVSDDRQTAGQGNNYLRLAADGLLLRGEQTDYTYATDLSQIGIGTLGFSLASGSGQLQLPLLAGQGEQTALFAMDLTGLQADEAVWLLIGGAMAPEGLHQPADLRLAIRATGEILNDLTDVQNVARRIDVDAVVVALRTLSLDDLRLAYAGAELTGTGAIGWDELQALTAALPPPSGQGDFVLTGAYALLDQVARAGLLPPEGIAGVRAALAGFGRPTGEDRLESTIALDESGRMTVNGAPVPF